MEYQESTTGHIVPKIVCERATQSLEHCLDGVDGIEAIVITSIDGFEVVARSTIPDAIAKLSAIASSVSAIGNMTVKETDLGEHYHFVIVESDNGFILIMDVHNESYPMIINVVASKKAVLAHVKYRVKLLSEILAKEVFF